MWKEPGNSLAAGPGAPPSPTNFLGNIDWRMPLFRAALDLVAGSAAGAHPITRATHNGGQIEPVSRPFACTVLLESDLTALEEPKRANAVPPGSVGEPDADLGETLPKVAFLGWPSFPSGLKYLMRGEGPAFFHQPPGRDQRLHRWQRLLRDRLDASASVR